jgi:hypothetical protein
VILLGIDSGLDGAVVAIQYEPAGVTRIVLAAIVPTIKTGTKRVYRVGEMVAFLRGIGPVGFAALERGGVRPGEGVKSSWSVGYGFGLWEMALTSLGVRYETPTPQQWQKDLYRGIVGDGKERSVLVCDRLLPDLNLTPGRRTKPHSGLADAGCLAVYAGRRALCPSQA